MGNKNVELKVGIFVFIAIVCLCTMIISFGIDGFQFGKKTYEITAVFKFTNGVIVGAPVRSAGVEVGKVSAINFEPNRDNYVRVVMKIDDGIVLRKDTRVIINSLGIIGEKYIEFIPQGIHADPLKNGDIILGETPVSMTDIMKEGQDVLGDIRDAIKQLLDEENIANIKKTISNIHQFTAQDIPEVKDDIRGAINKFDNSMSKMASVLSEVESIIAENKDSFNTSISGAKTAFAEIGTASKEVRVMIKSMQEVILKIGGVVDMIQQGEGTIGQLVSERELYDEFTLFVQKLNALVDMLKEKGLLYKPRKERKRKR